jgi:hypothetical protein
VMETVAPADSRTYLAAWAMGMSGTRSTGTGAASWRSGPDKSAWGDAYPVRTAGPC